MRLLHKLTPLVHKSAALVLLLICVLNLTSCFYQNDKYSPCHQPGTTWVSSDGRVTINIDENGVGCGTVEIDGVIYDFTYKEEFHYGSFVIRHRCYIVIESAELKEGDVIGSEPGLFWEYWNIDCYKKDYFRAVTTHNSVYEYGTTVEFHKIK